MLFPMMYNLRPTTHLHINQTILERKTKKKGKVLTAQTSHTNPEYYVSSSGPPNQQDSTAAEVFASPPLQLEEVVVVGTGTGA